MGLSQEKLAVYADISRQTLRNIEQGKGSPQVDTLKAVLEALGTNFEEALRERNDASQKAVS